jgi:alkanesulfonate monooxygenase SsuD/methylene tetrahydromethanopterin reductase-like flavin-dependent oxidoreductase (luciferase family)
MSLKLGLLYSFRNPAYKRTSWPQVYQDELDMAVYADELGYDNVWMSEHHFVDDGYMPSPLTIAAAVAARTKTIRIGTYILLLPLHDPLRVAETAATIDLISNGRFDLGLGLGYRPGELDGAGVPSSERGARMAEGAPLIQRLFTEQNITFDGRYNTLKDVTLTPPPVQKPHPPIWVGARAPKALDRAAKHGFHLASVGPPEHRLEYLEALERHGRNPKDYNVGQLIVVFVGETTQQAWGRCADGLYHMLSCYLDWAIESGDVVVEPNWDRRKIIRPPDEMRRTQDADFLGQPTFVGAPDEVYERLAEFQEQSPGTHFAMIMNYPGADPAHTRESMELFAAEVAPRLRAL